MLKRKIKTEIEISARHIHLCKKDLEKLFGKDYQLKPYKFLSQSKEFASQEILTIKTKKYQIEGVRILGPLRDYTQIELSKTDAYLFGLNPPVRMSGDHKDTPGIAIIGPKGKVNKKQGVILAQRHIHCSEKMAKKYNLKNCQSVCVEVPGKRGLVFKNVKIKIHSDYSWYMHLDVDEWNAAGLEFGKNTGNVIF